MKKTLDLFFFGDGTDLPGIRTALLALLSCYLLVGKALILLPLDGAAGDILQDRFILGE